MISRPLIAVASATMLLAACGNPLDPVDCGPEGGGCARPPAEDAPPAPLPPPAPEAVPAAVSPVHIQAAERFVRALYARMDDDAFAALSRDQTHLIFTEETARLIERARDWTGEGAHPALEADPLCLCQDPLGLVLRDLRVEAGEGGRATARARFDFGAADDARETILDLRREGEAWRVDDVRTDDGFSFRQALLQPA